MSTLIKERSTYWVRSGTNTHDNNGDYRAYWKIYYDTDAANNRTLITVEYDIQTWSPAGDLIWTYGSKTSSCNVNGSSIGSVTISYTNGATISNGIHKKGTKTTYVYHNSDGSASFTWSGSGAGKSTSTTTYSTANGDFPAIPQGTSVSQSFGAKSESSIVVNWNTADAADYIWYSINGGSSYTAVGSVSGTSGSYTISGLSPNTTYSIVTRARRQSSQIDTNYTGVSNITTFNAPSITSISDVTETSFKINWSCEYSYSTAQYSINNGSSWSNMPSGNVISGLSANTNYQVKVRAQVSGLSMYETGSTMVEKSTYDYPKATSMNNFTIGDGASVYLYNPLGREVTLQILQSNTNTLLGTYTGTYQGVVNGEFKTSDAINRQYQSIPNNSSGTYYCKVTYSNISTKTYEDINNHTYSVNQSINKPTISASNFSCYDINNTTLALTGNSSIIVNNYSTLKIEQSTAPTTQNYATPSTYYINGTPYTYSSSFATQISNYPSSTVTIYVVDSRGIPSDAITINLTAKDYFDITTGNFNSSRNNQGVGNEVTFSFEGTFWNKSFGSVTNSLSANYSIYNQKTGVTTTGTSTITPTVNGNSYEFEDVLYGDTSNGFDVDTKYTVTINISDSLSTAQFVYTIIEGTPAIALYGNKISLGAKYDTNLGGNVQLNGTIYINGKTPTNIDAIYPVGSVYLSVNSTSPATLFGGTWQRLDGYYLYAGTGGNTAGSNTTSSAGGGTTGSTTLTSAQSGLRWHHHPATSTYSGANFYIRHGNTAGTDTVAGGTNTSIDEGVGDTWGNGFSTSTYSHKIDRVNIGGTVSTTVDDVGGLNATDGHTHTMSDHTHTATPLRFEVYAWYRTA